MYLPVLVFSYLTYCQTLNMYNNKFLVKSDQVLGITWASEGFKKGGDQNKEFSHTKH